MFDVGVTDKQEPADQKITMSWSTKSRRTKAEQLRRNKKSEVRGSSAKHAKLLTYLVENFGNLFDKLK